MSTPRQNERGSGSKRKSEPCLVPGEEDGGRVTTVEAGAGGIRAVRRREGESAAEAGSQVGANSEMDIEAGKSLYVFVKLFSGKSLGISLSPEETVYSLREKIAKATGIPVNVDDHRLSYGRKKLVEWKKVEDYGIERDSTLHLVGRISSCGDMVLWRNLDAVVSAAIRLLKGEFCARSADTVKVGMDSFLDGVKVFMGNSKTPDGWWITLQRKKHLKKYFDVLNSVSAVNALSMLYLSPVKDNKEVGHAVIQKFFYAVQKFPKELHAHALPLVLQFCMNLRATEPWSAFYFLCRSTLLYLIKTVYVPGSAKDVQTSVSFREIFPIFIAVGSTLLFGLTKSARSPSIITLNIQDVQDFSLLLNIVLSKISKKLNLEDPILMFDEAIEHPCCEQLQLLCWVFKELLNKMDVCLRGDDSSSSTNHKICTYNDVGYQYLLILRALKSISAIYKGAPEDVEALLKTRKIAFRVLVMSFAEKIEDKSWLLEHKDILGFGCRRHLAMMALPDCDEDDCDAYDMLIDRSNLRAESIENIMEAEPEDLHVGLSIRFKNEEARGVAVMLEWFIMVIKELFSTSALFIANPSDHRRFYINPMSEVVPCNLIYFRACGRILALAMMSKVQVGIALDRVLFLQLAGHNVKLDDIKDTDPALYHSCKTILHMDAPLVDADTLGLTFVTEYGASPANKVVELCPNGAYTKVNSSNRDAYIGSLIYSRFVESTSIQLAEFAKGFEDVVSNSENRFFCFRSLKLEDLDLMLRGRESDISIEDWKAHTDYGSRYTDTDPHIIWFWKIVTNLSPEQRRQLLFFWTAIKYLPFEGFSGLSRRLKISELFETTYLPASYTCMNQFFLPKYPTYEVMQQSIAVIIQEHIAASFGIC